MNRLTGRSATAAIRFAAILVVAVCTGALLPAGAGEEPIHTETLANGTTLVIQARPGCGTFAADLTALGGSAEDPDELFGRTSILARMLLRGSETLSADERARQVERTGSTLEAYGGVTGLLVAASGPAAAFPEVFDILADCALRPRLASADLGREITLARQSLKGSRDNPSEALGRTALPLIYGDHPLGRVPGDPESYLSKVDLASIRRAHDERFVGRRLLVVIVGEVDPVAARDRVAAAFGGLPEGEAALLPLAPPRPLREDARARAHRRTSQPELLVAMPTAGVADQDEPAFQLLSHILAGFEERLSAEIREKRGWAYWLGSWNATYPGAGTFGVVTAVPRRHLGEAETIIREELGRIASEPPAAEEVERARRFMLTSLARSWQMSASRAGRFTTDLVNGRAPRGYDEVASRYDRVSPEEIRDLARRLLDSSKLAVVTLY